VDDGEGGDVDVSRKDYREIAQAIKEMKRQYPNEQEIITLFASAMAVRLKKDNPRFSYEKFWDYIQR
jgi:hypothetical protein